MFRPTQLMAKYAVAEVAEAQAAQAKQLEFQLSSRPQHINMYTREVGFVCWPLIADNKLSGSLSIPLIPRCIWGHHLLNLRSPWQCRCASCLVIPEQ